MSGMSFCRVLAITAVAFSAWAPAAPADEMVPFEARIEGFANPVFNPDGTISNTEAAAGHALHLGLCTWASEELAEFTGPNELHVLGSFTMTAANGDQLFGAYETIGTVDFPLGVFIGPYEVTGGTGRFAHATGSGTIVGFGNLLPPFEFVGSLAGSISRPNQ